MSLSPSDADRTPTRPIVLLAVAGFASQAQVRVTDSLLPTIADDFGTTVGAAAMVVTAYAVAHGSVQLFIGPIGDRFGKYLTVAVMALCSAIFVMACGFTDTLTGLAAARLLAGACAGWVIPLSMAYIGDVISYDRRQTVLGRYLTGQITGQLFGQAAGGVLGDLFGWRSVFFILGTLFALAALGLIYELITNPRTRPAGRPEERSRGFVADYKEVLSSRWARIVIVAVAIESAFGWGAFAYLSADLNRRFGLSLSAAGLIVGMFAIGGLAYTATVRQLVERFGQSGLAVGGAAICGFAYLALAGGFAWWLAPLAVGLYGFGFYALHNTLQTCGTQMTPQARATGFALFSSAIYGAQTVGVGAGGLVFDRFGAVPLFVVSGLVLPLMAVWFARELRQRG